MAVALQHTTKMYMQRNGQQYIVQVCMHSVKSTVNQEIFGVKKLLVHDSINENKTDKIFK